MTSMSMYQVAPYPVELAKLVAGCRHRAHEGWSVHLEDDCKRDKDPDTKEVVGFGLTLVIGTIGFNTYHPELGRSYPVNHFFIVPAATFNRQAWLEWLFDCYRLVEQHETMENFIVDGERPFAPTHGMGDNPYIVHYTATPEQAKTRFTQKSPAS